MRHARGSVIAVLTCALSALAAPAAQATIIAGAVNHIADGPQTITFTLAQYTPKFLAVSPGPTTWSGAFASHPLTFEDGTPSVTSGTSSAIDLRPGVVRYYCRIHGAAGGLGMSGIVYVAGPDAALKATPASLPAAGEVTLDASSTDFVDTTPNTTATYAFDADGDGTFETSGGSPAPPAAYGLGTHTARVRVTDDDDRVGEATVTVVVGLPPAPTTPAGGGPAPAPAGGAVDATAPTLVPARIPAQRRAGLASGTVRLRAGRLSERSVVRASLRLRGKTIGRAATTTAPAGDLRVTVRLTEAGRRLIRSARPTKLTLRLELTDAAGNRRVVDRPVRLRR